MQLPLTGSIFSILSLSDPPLSANSSEKTNSSSSSSLEASKRRRRSTKIEERETIYTQSKTLFSKYLLQFDGQLEYLLGSSQLPQPVVQDSSLRTALQHPIIHTYINPATTVSLSSMHHLSPSSLSLPPSSLPLSFFSLENSFAVQVTC